MEHKYYPSFLIERNKLIHKSEYYFNGGYKEKKREIWYLVDLTDPKYLFIIISVIYNKKDLAN